MYKIKRFSSTRPRGLGMERYFSEYLEQREYGLGKEIKQIVSNIRKSGFKEGVKKFKEDKLSLLSKEIKDPEDRKSSIMYMREKVMKPRTVRDKTVVDNISNEAKKHDAKILNLDLGKAGKDVEVKVNGITIDKFKPEVSAHSRSKDISESMRNKVKEAEGDKGLGLFDKASKSNKHVILHPEKSLTEELAHEIGHVKNSDSLNPIHRINHDIASNIDMSELAKSSKGQSGLISSAKNYLKGKIKLSEESRATKKAEEIMRRSGMADGDIKLAMDNLGKLKKTYEIDHEVAYKNPLINKLKKDLGKE